MNLKSNIFNGGLVKDAVENAGATLVPIIFPIDYSKTSTLMNPSIYNDNGKLVMCVRGTNYTLHHSEYGYYPHWAGPLQYIHPENDVRLATENYFVDVDHDTLICSNPRIVKMMESVHRWSFHGLEDARLFRWDNKLYFCGVRRDTTDNGQGRMELSELSVSAEEVVEISRKRIPTYTDIEYCEKNWMPVLDRPYHYVKWTNPLEVIKINDINVNQLSISRLTEYDNELSEFKEIRGSSQVIPYKDYYIAIGHSIKLWKPYSGEKDAEYWEHIIIWDKNFKLIKISEPFKFINSAIEFCCGACLDNNGQLIISFAECDNASFLLRLNPDWLISKILN